MTTPFSRSSVRRIARLIGIVGAVFLLGCESPPPPPPPPRALTISAQRGQSQAQQDRDATDCQSMASAQANSSQSWAQIFTACMSGRGYYVE